LSELIKSAAWSHYRSRVRCWAANRLSHHPGPSGRAVMAGLKGGQYGQLSRTPRCKGAPRDEIYLFQIKYSFEKFSWFRSDTRIQLFHYIPICCVKYQGPPT